MLPTMTNVEGLMERLQSEGAAVEAALDRLEQSFSGEHVRMILRALLMDRRAKGLPVTEGVVSAEFTCGERRIILTASLEA